MLGVQCTFSSIKDFHFLLLINPLEREKYYVSRQKNSPGCVLSSLTKPSRRHHFWMKEAEHSAKSGNWEEARKLQKGYLRTQFLILTYSTHIRCFHSFIPRHVTGYSVNGIYNLYWLIFLWVIVASCGTMLFIGFHASLQSISNWHSVQLCSPEFMWLTNV